MLARPIVFAFAALPLILTACAQKVGLQGKVIAGPASSIVAAGESDPRFKEESGLEGATVTVRGTGNDTTVYGTGESGKDGQFSISIRDQRALMHPLEFSARREGYVDARVNMHLPTRDRRVLVILKPGPGAGGR